MQSNRDNFDDFLPQQRVKTKKEAISIITNSYNNYLKIITNLKLNIMNYSIIEALNYINKNMPVNLDILISIERGKNNHIFILTFNEGTKYLIDLDDKTIIKL